MAASATAHPTLVSPEAAIATFLTRLEKPARLLVAISGGSDSTGLLVALREVILKAYPSGSIELLAVTVDHALRPNSADEALCVAKLCRQLVIPHVIRRWDGEKPATGLSAAARAARYRLLCDTADEFGATAILTGHTRDDQIETLVMRGARLHGKHDSLADAAACDTSEPSAEYLFNPGLAGMASAVLVEGRHWLLRPFLDVQRADIRQMLQASAIGWIDDPSNVDPRFERARTRQRLADGGGDGQALLQSATRIGAERARLGAEVADLFARHLTIEGSVLARLQAPALDAEPAVLLCALSNLTAVLGGRAHGPGRDSLRRIAAFVGEGGAGRLTAGRVLFQRHRQALFMTRESRDLPHVAVVHGPEILWDGRFRIRTSAACGVDVGPGAPDQMAAQARFADAPPAIALAAYRSLPQLERTFQGADAVLIKPVLQPFDAFLPAFDVDIANSLAIAMGLRVFAPLPFNVFDRKR
ncbi:tRNA(Ile)-lysidine synthase [Neorhizobium galegae]|uniref:tRNA lysidine(34) synthetase TilS n=1 Tax=Neorhizobium galegae TaxID=399 RepID=UPI001AE69314|nr:tRNA(Ile)-lysidine synthase [Neorhizobium galegae]